MRLPSGSIPSENELHPIFSSEGDCIQFLSEQRVFYEQMRCDCGREMQIKLDRHCFRCPAKGCQKEKSHRVHTFFFGSKLECRAIMRLGYLWLAKTPISTACTLTGHSDKTVGIFYRHYRQLVASTLAEERALVGGPGVVVEIDETKMGKRKFHRGHHVEGVWILGGVERTTERQVFLRVVDNRNAETLTNVIKDCVHPDSIIITDLWKAYSSLGSKLGFAHLTVNHSVTFKDPETGAHTNSIEGTWNGLKMFIGARNRVKNGMDEFLFEFIWRRKNTGYLWDDFIGAMRDIHYTLE